MSLVRTPAPLSTSVRSATEIPSSSLMPFTTAPAADPAANIASTKTRVELRSTFTSVTSIGWTAPGLRGAAQRPPAAGATSTDRNATLASLQTSTPPDPPAARFDIAIRGRLLPRIGELHRGEVDIAL